MEFPKFRPGEDLSLEKAKEATKKLEAGRSEKALEEAAEGVKKMLEEGYDLEEILESIRKEVGDNKENLH